MVCCTNCFTSKYLQSIIKSKNINGICDFCDSRNIPVYDPKELLVFFQGILDLYKVDSASGAPIDIQIDKEFNGKIFSDRISKKRLDLLREITKKESVKYNNLLKKNVISRLIQNSHNATYVESLKISWDIFADEIKTKNRFHIKNALDLTNLQRILNRYGQVAKKGKKYYRARISLDKKAYPKKELKNPPMKLTKGGRANPPGISYLYLSDSIETTLYEVRASLYDYVSVGDFLLQKDINIIRLSNDLIDPIILSEQGDLEDYIVHQPFITKLEEELSKPKRRSDDEMDYLPTQYLTEFIKHIGFDGIEYQSSLYKDGFNYAIFYPDKFKCTKVRLCEIKDMKLDHDII